MSPVHVAVMVMVGTGAVLLVVAAAMTVARVARGPSSLDRVVAADVLVAVVIATLAAEAVVEGRTTTLPVMLVLSLLGFAGAVSIARFVAERDTVVPRDDPGTRPGDGAR